MRASQSLFVYFAALAAVDTAICGTTSRPDGPFQLYAYGEEVGGLVLFSDGESIYAGNYTTFESAQAAPVVFTDNGGTWSCSPNTTDLASDSQPEWSNLTLSIPDPTSSSHDVGLVNGTAEDASETITTGFSFYGSVAFASNDGQLVSKWYGTPSDKEGVYTVKWNETDATDATVLFTLKATAPLDL